ncbi:hypothetical protein D9611_013409 [Ephemerocybe angulata]|uniref:Uncharacterized protein n=1 Tax=Ephemerocybe angulata TaxID=980116 RepID=A0A8H5BUK1_9AGAR|nr:hypothetical protein D9611_013409 [Tulosesus angulatus]
MSRSGSRFEPAHLTVTGQVLRSDASVFNTCACFFKASTSQISFKAGESVARAGYTEDLASKTRRVPGYFPPQSTDPRLPCRKDFIASAISARASSKGIPSNEHVGAFKKSLKLASTWEWDIAPGVGVTSLDHPFHLDVTGTGEGLSETVALNRIFPPRSSVAPSVRLPSGCLSKVVEARDNALCALTASTAQSLSKGGDVTSWEYLMGIIQANPTVSVLILNERNAHDRIPAEFHSQDELTIRENIGYKGRSTEKLAFELYNWFTDILAARGEVIPGDLEDLRNSCIRTVAGLGALSAQFHDAKEGVPAERARHAMKIVGKENLNICYTTAESGILRYPNIESPVLMAYRFEVVATLRWKRCKGTQKWKHTFRIGAEVNRKYYQVLRKTSLIRGLSILSSPQSPSLWDLCTAYRVLHRGKNGSRIEREGTVV